MSSEKVRMLADTVMKDASPEELQFFAEVCRRTKLDPFRKQIHAVKRWDSKAKREVWSFQTGVDGFRAIAHRTGECAGIDDAVFDPVDESADLPRSATVTVWRLVQGQRVPFSAKARWSEYVQTTKDGNITSMWRKLPYSQLAKCAECLALRKAFPEDLSELRSTEEMDQSENPEPAPMSQYRLTELEDAAPAVKPAAVVAEPAAKMAPVEAIEAEVVTSPKAAAETTPPALPGYALPEAVAEFVGGKWKLLKLEDGRRLGTLKIADLTRYREQMPEPLRTALLASYVDQILAILGKAGITEEDFATEAADETLGFPVDVWMEVGTYPALLDLAKKMAAGEGRGE